MMSTVAFIICYDEERYLEECVAYIQQLYIPKGFKTDIIGIRDAEDMMEAYNAAMQECDARYKVYLEQHTFIVNQYFLYEILDAFHQNTNLGMLGVLGGSEPDGEFDKGRILLWSEEGIGEVNYQRENACEKVAVLSDVLLATQYDLEWQENPCGNFVDHGYEVAVPFQKSPWCVYDCRMENVSEGEHEYQFQLLHTEIFHDFEGRGVWEPLLRKMGINWKEHLNRANRQAHAKVIMGYYWEDVLSGTRKHKKYLKPDGVVGLDREKNDTMNVAMSFNHGYVTYAQVMLQSLYENHKLVNICVHVLQMNLTEDDKQRLKEQAMQFSNEIVFYDFHMEWLPEGLKVTSEWSIEAYFRLFMVDILPVSVERVLYLDVDVIVNKPIYEFYYMDMQGCEIVGCRDFGMIFKEEFTDKRKELFAPISSDADFVYINSGVMLMDMDRLRCRVNGMDYLKLEEENHGRLLAPDQDIINLMHWKQVGLVDEYRYDFFNACFKHLKAEEVRQSVSIIHYAGPKPWMPIDISKHAHQIWWEYALRTPVYANLQKSGWEKEL